jgi:hypothetical protein
MPGQYAPAMKRRQLIREAVAERESDLPELTRDVFRHPWMVGLGWGALLATAGLDIGVAWPVAVGVGVVAMLFTGVVCRRQHR